MKLARIAIALTVLFSLAPVAEARPKLTRSILKTFFETGDRPTQEQFATLIDSTIHFNEDRELLGLYVSGAEGYRIHRLRIGDTIPTGQGTDGSHYVLPTPSSLFQMAPEFAGEFGFVGLLYGDTTGNHYFGMLQVSMEPLTPAIETASPGIFVSYLTMETDPNTTFDAFVVPEPTVMAALALTGALLNRRRA